MWTVYGIYAEGLRNPLYIGCTELPIAVRFNAHRTNKVIRSRGIDCPKTHPRKKLKAILFGMHKMGDLSLSIRPIAELESKEAAFAIEHFAIAEKQPAINVNRAPKYTMGCVIPQNRSEFIATWGLAIEQAIANGRDPGTWMTEIHERAVAEAEQQKMRRAMMKKYKAA